MLGHPAHGFDALAMTRYLRVRKGIALFIPLEIAGETVGTADEKAGIFENLHFQSDAAFLGIGQGRHSVQGVVDHIGQKHGQVGINNADVLRNLHRGLERSIQFLGLDLAIGHQGVDEGMVGIPTRGLADLSGEMLHILLHPLEIPLLA